MHASTTNTSRGRHSTIPIRLNWIKMVTIDLVTRAVNVAVNGEVKLHPEVETKEENQAGGEIKAP